MGNHFEIFEGGFVDISHARSVLKAGVIKQVNQSGVN